MKAKGVLSFTTFTTFRDFSFTGNSLTACNLGDSVKAVKAKNKTFNVVTRAYASVRVRMRTCGDRNAHDRERGGEKKVGERNRNRRGRNLPLR